MSSKSLAAVFAREVRTARHALGFTQAELSERIGLAVEAYGRLERGAALPRADTLVRLAGALGVTTDSLLGLSSERPAARRFAAEPEGEYAAPSETRRIVRQLRNESRRTGRLIEALASSLEPRRSGR